MVSLTSLHHEALEEIFHQLNQYHTSALAPLHSKLYYVAKPKLYRNIYVYIPWLLNDFLEPNEGNSTFRFPKDLNNCKSTRYTIISTDTLERYLMKMDGTQEINRLELYGHNMTMIDCIFRHLTKIKYFQLVSILDITDGPGYTNSIQKFLDTYGYGSHYITPYVFRKFSDPILISGRLVKVDEWYCCNVIDKLHLSMNLKELSIITFCSRYRMRTRFNTQLHVLNFYDCLDSMGSNFLICDFFDTNCLRELSLKGDLDLNTTFNCTDMEKEFPKLEQLCLRFSGPRYAPTALYKLTNFRHSRLRSLVISSKSCHECDARAVCDLCPQFPNSSINWWSEVFECCTRNIHSYCMKILSPNLPYGVVGYHFFEFSREDLTHFEHTVRDSLRGEVVAKLERWYTPTELRTIYNLRDSQSQRRSER